VPDAPSAEQPATSMMPLMRTGPMTAIGHIAQQAIVTI
jgi:hypothetical protein